MSKLAEISEPKLGVAKRRARLKAVDILHSAYLDANKKYGMTRADFAKRIGRKPSQLSRILSGTQNVTVEMVEAVLRAFEARLVVSYELLDQLEVRQSNKYIHQLKANMDFFEPSKKSNRSSGKYKTSEMKHGDYISK